MSRELPASPSIEFIKDEARKLLRAHQAKDPSVMSILRNVHRFAGKPTHEVLDADVSLQEIQFALALDYGFKGWDDLKRYIATRPTDVGPASKEVFEALQESTAWTGEPYRWADAMVVRPSGTPPFLDPASLPGRCRAASLPADRAPQLVALAEEIARDPALMAFAWYIYWRVWVAKDHRGEWDKPTLKPRLGDRSGLFYLLVALDLPGRLAERHRSMGYPPEVTAATASEVAADEAEHVAGTGRPGIYAAALKWLHISLEDRSVRLGRLVFDVFDCWNQTTEIFRRDTDGAVIALAATGMPVTDDGLFLDWEKPSAGAAWETTLHQTPEAFVGYPAHPAGRILRQEVRLPRPAWKHLLHMTGVGTTDDMLLYMHVPFGGGLTADAVGDSLRRACEFFPRYYPDRSFKLVQMETWFLDPRVPGLLGSESNTARFQRHCYLVPETPNSELVARKVFQRDLATTPVADLPERTSVQRAIKDFLRKGGAWHGGRMFMLAEDMANPREGVYLDRFAALARELGIHG